MSDERKPGRFDGRDVILLAGGLLLAVGAGAAWLPLGPAVLGTLLLGLWIDTTPRAR